MAFMNLFVIIGLVSSTALASVTRNRSYHCRPNDYRCKDDSCISFDKICDGITDCFDGDDETICDGESISFWKNEDPVLNRLKRQTTANCRKNQWQCRDGSCITFDGKCDGVVDCVDGSDETHALCRKTQCQSNWFRCTYGACVDGTAPCNGVQECADNSDELLPRCRNETEEIRGQFKCQDGRFILAANRCDGAVDCTDGSDETVRACAGMTCPSYLFQCAYGACVDQGADCNQITDCADGSDESAELCDKMAPVTPVNKTKPTGPCILPAYPEHGSYSVTNAPTAVPGQGFNTLELNVTCNPGYGTIGSSIVYCISGKWSAQQLPQCIRFCKLNSHPSVRYTCILSGNNDGFRPCKTYEPHGTQVHPMCNTPNYYTPTNFNYMNCIDGNWDYIATCLPECGKVTPDGEQLIIDGWSAKHGELPWHTGIYRKTTSPYMQICGGSLISTSVVISAAHCFWSDLENQLPAENYAIAVGKIYRPWNNPQDKFAQKSDVKDIKIPQRFRGSSTNFQDDIAIVIAVTAFEYKTYVRPICLDFNVNFERSQLQEGKLGKVAGWGLTSEDGVASPVLKVVNLPYVEIGNCLAKAQIGFVEYITSDKICAGYGNGTALCKGDSGGGLVFPEYDRFTERFYLRGVVSTAPNNEHLCNAFTLTTFTEILKHEHFIKQNIRATE